jgi:Uma2 family endonuclease
MSTQPAVREWTYAEFARLPDDGNRYEVIAGELYVTPAPNSLHQQIGVRLVLALGGFVARHGLGVVYTAPYDVIFGEGDYVQPDVIYVRRERVNDVIRDHGAVGPPHLVVEILSGSTEQRDRGLKRERYAQYGVPEYWIIDPGAKHVEVYRLTRGDLRRVLVENDALRYRPAPGGPELVVDVPHLLRPANDFSEPRWPSA